MLELKQHSLESSRSAVYWTFSDCHQRLVVSFNGHWFAVDVIIELGTSKNYSEKLFFYLRIAHFSLCEDP